ACDTLTVSFSKASTEALNKIKTLQGIEKTTLENNTISMLVSPSKRNVIDIIDDLKNLGIKLSSFRYDEVNLESIFLQVTGKSLRD
ncbi:MAG TPA: export ABC transporter ATP-binding protein, partial [Clostridium sp.]